MSDWPVQALPLMTPFGAVSTVGEGSPVAEVALTTGTVIASGAWPSANLAIYAPIVVPAPIIVNKLGWYNGSVVSGNVDAGVYDSELTQLIHTGSTAQATTTTVQQASVTATLLNPGLYYLGLSADNVTAQFQRLSLAAAILRASGVAQQATAFALPATATFAAMAQAYLPVILAGLQPSLL